MLMLSGIFLVAAVVAAIVAYGGANAPTTGPFVTAFYFAAALFVIFLVIGLAQQYAFVSN